MAIIYVGAGETYTNLHAGFAAMSANDEMIIRGGVYTGVTNMIRQSVGMFPPSGSGVGTDPNNGYTIIRAENDGAVDIDGENINLTFYLNDGSHAYIKYRGVEFIRPDNDWADAVAPVKIGPSADAHHLKFIRVGAMVDSYSGNGAMFYVTGNQDMLFEECYFWGDARHGMLLFYADRIIVRRCVGRLDKVDADSNPVSLFQSYASPNVQWQNCIAIDSDSTYYSNVSYIGSAFNTRKEYVGNFAENNIFQGNIALNIHHYDGGTFEDPEVVGPAFQIALDGDVELPNKYYHNVGWDVSAGIRWTGPTVALPTVENMTLYVPRGVVDVNDEGYLAQHTNLSLMDSVLIGGDKFGLKYGIDSDYNLIWDCADDYVNITPGENDITVDLGNAINPIYNSSTNPTGGLKYITRTEEGSSISEVGEGGLPIGANIQYRYGVSGTLYGEDGYDTLTDEPLWPFPFEVIIQASMKSYNPGGTDGTRPDGERGFGADDQTLTNYIWGYLGNTVPPFGVAAVENGADIDVSWDEPAAVALTNITDFLVYSVINGEESLVATVEGNETFSTVIEGLSLSSGDSIIVTSVDSVTGESSAGYPVLFAGSDDSGNSVVTMAGRSPGTTMAGRSPSVTMTATREA